MSGNKSGFRPDHVIDYFKKEKYVLVLVTVSGIIYNIGLVAGPWFEGQLAECLLNILNGTEVFGTMLRLVAGYIAAILVVQLARLVKRFYVRHFANNVNRRMKKVLYASLIRKSRKELESEGLGNIMTKAVSDVDDCAEGMRKFTTEVFDTGVAMVAYVVMLLHYDWRLSLIVMLFPPIAYWLAEHMKKAVQKANSDFKVKSGILSAATLDRVSNALTYRVFGCEDERKRDYEDKLTGYEKTAVRSNIISTALPPMYQIISMIGVIFILYFGARNMLHTGWCDWDIAALTTYLACFNKLSVKTSKSAKLFNSVHKAQVSWKRVLPYLESETVQPEVSDVAPETLTAEGLSFAYNENTPVFTNLDFKAAPGEIIGITGPVACGKTTLGRALLGEEEYEGHVLFGNEELKDMDEIRKRSVIGYLGHDPELLNVSVEDNICMGDDIPTDMWLKMVDMDAEVAEMEQKDKTVVGDGGVKLSGGQAKRLALARTLAHKRPVLILDDPFSALDRKTEEKIFASVRDYCSDSVILLISHRLYLFPELSRIIWMEDGKTTVGTHDELMQSVPEYAQMYHTGNA